MNRRSFSLTAFLLTLLCSATLHAAELYWVDTDAYGTIVGISKEDGTRVWSGEYYPFGEQFRTPNQRIKNQRTFLGKEFEPKTGLTAVGARNYSSELGRFTSADPIGPVNPWTSETNYEYLANPHRLNRYAYGMNNPYRYVDPDGLFPEKSAGQLEFGNPGSYGGTNDIGSMLDDDYYTELPTETEVESIIEMLPIAGVSVKSKAIYRATAKAAEKIGIYGKKIGAGRKPQPFSKVSGQYVSPDKTIGSKADAASLSTVGQFLAGFSQGFASGQSMGVNPPPAVTKAQNWGQSIGLTIGNIVSF